MCTSLGPHRSCCEVDGRTIILEARGDRYWQLGPRLSQLLSDHIRDHAASESVALAELRRANILSGTDPVCEIPLPGLASRTILDQPTPWHTGLCAISALCFARVTLELKRGNFYRVIDRLRSAKRRPTRSGYVDQAEVARVCAAVRAVVRFVGLEGRCLPHGLTLANMLAMRGLPSTLVIGVAIRPFAAHCWVQQDDRVLSDRVETIANYTPILAV